MSSRKIVLIVDNCPCHPRIENLRNTKLMFLPPNTTAFTQPMDAGVTRNTQEIISFFRDRPVGVFKIESTPDELQLGGIVVAK